jgi:hypothetical protein
MSLSNDSERVARSAWTHGELPVDIGQKDHKAGLEMLRVHRPDGSKCDIVVDRSRHQCGARATLVRLDFAGSVGGLKTKPASRRPQRRLA